MKKLSLYIFLILFWFDVGFSEEIDYKKTLLKNKIIATYNETGKHEVVFYEDGKVKFKVTHIPTNEIIGEFEKCWEKTEFNENTFRLWDCSETIERKNFHINKFDFINMTFLRRTVYQDAYFKIIKPLKIFYK